VDLKKYCAQNDTRKWLTEPFNIKDRTAATNGLIIVSVPKTGGYSDMERKTLLPSIEKLITLRPTYTSCPDIDLPRSTACTTCEGARKAEVSICHECEGEGKITFETDYNEYVVECASCCGDGEIINVGGDHDCPACSGTGKEYPHDARVNLDGVDFPIAAACAALLKEFDNLQIDADNEARCLYFKSGDVIGALMGLRRIKETA